LSIETAQIYLFVFLAASAAGLLVDMFVDLPASAVRYGFRTLADAAFKRRFVHATQCELSWAAIDHGWPHQVVLPARLCERDG
jgi:hypothetical protein